MKKHDSEVPNVTHRYPDRALFLCQLYVSLSIGRFCYAKNVKSGIHIQYLKNNIEIGLDYIRSHPEIRGRPSSLAGDPLMLTDKKIDMVVGGLRDIGPFRE